MQKYEYLVLGGGVAAGYAAETFIEEGGKAGDLCIVSAEAQPPYERPPLSKDILTGEEESDNIFINEPDYYADHGIALKLNTQVEKVDFHKRLLYSQQEEVGFEKLIIATGSQVRTLELPGSELDNIFYLRTIEDALQIRAASKDAQQAVIIGGSFIGMEVASSLQQSDVQSTLVFPQSRVWASFFTPEMSHFFEEHYRAQGVALVKQANVVGFEGNGQVTAVKLDNGEQLAADLVVAGIGVIPNVALFRQSGLAINEGILVNDHLETNIPGIYAVGDVAEYEDAIFNTRRRVEHWDNAFVQGQHVMKSMLGRPEPFVHVPYFFSDVFDLSFEYWGDGSGHDEVIYRGEVESGSFSTWWLRDKRLVAAFAMDRPEAEGEFAEQWIQSGAEIPVELLRNPQTDLAGMVEQG
jgi:NAD(P)H-nitrite reductase large subunit